MLRLLAVVALLVIVHAPVSNAAPCAGFTDVDTASPFCTNVAWMKSRNITLGCTATLYCPDQYVTRLQMAAFMYRLGFQNALLNGGNAFGATAVAGTTDNHAVEVRVNNVRALRLEPTASVPNVLGGFANNGVYAGVVGAVIAGGGAPGAVYRSLPCGLAFGCQNSITDHYGTIGGGLGNLAGDTDGDLDNGEFGTVGGGLENAAARYGSVGGGRDNRASAFGAVIGGLGNRATGNYSAVLGGIGNVASGSPSIAGGNDSEATASYTVAIGTGARADETGCMVFADRSSLNTTSCGTANQFIVRAQGGVYLLTAGTSDLTYTGAVLGPGSTAWAAFSDREGKESISPVDAEEILRRVVAMPLSTWQWKSEPGAVRHMGPMAQDFHAAFGLGASEKQIVTVDADGVALAAIQGLNAKFDAKLAERDAEIAELRNAIAELKARIAER